jgi:hypothetical protein
MALSPDATCFDRRGATRTPISARRVLLRTAHGCAQPLVINLLGAVAVFALVFLLARDGARSANAPGTSSPGRDTRQAPPNATFPTTAQAASAGETAGQPVWPAVSARVDPNAEPHEAGTPTAQAPVYDASAVKLSEVHQIPAEVSGAADADTRAVMLRELGAQSSSESFAVLEETLRSDKVSRNRLLAVNSLRLLGKRDVNTERARNALYAAMSDADRNVAASARDAYDELAPAP